MRWKRMDDEKLSDYQTCTHRDCMGCSNRHPCRMDGGYTELATALKESYAYIDGLEATKSEGGCDERND